MFSNVASNGLYEKKHSHICCICLTFLHYVFSNVLSNCIFARMQNYTGCIDMAFLQCVFSYTSSNCLHAIMQSHTGCTILAFLRCVYFSFVSSLLLPKWMKSYIGNICLALLSPALSEWRDEGSCIFPFSNNCKSTLMTSTRREEKGPMNIPKRGFAHGLKCASIHPSIHQ